LHTAFRSINDPRIERKKKHSLLDIIILSVTGVLCGADGSEDIAEFGKIHLTFLRQFLELKNGIPSHDTIRRVFSNGKTETFERFYISSLAPDNQNFNQYICDHWGVENSLHWTLDMVFREDEQRKRAGHAAKNFAIVRKMALNI
jgi:predicted transposase YbfD/YdcC